jgi:ribosomal protein S18 acetylase RimI-like enzyme
MANPTPQPIEVYTSLPRERDAIGEITRRAGVFNAEEVTTVFELFDDYLRSPGSGYNFFSAKVDGRLAGFACWGLTPLTEGTYDLYWICTDPEQQNRGVGKALFQSVETAIRERNGRMMVIWTSSTAEYHPAVNFYERMGCSQAACLRDFYKPGDDLLIYQKDISKNR